MRSFFSYGDVALWHIVRTPQGSFLDVMRSFFSSVICHSNALRVVTPLSCFQSEGVSDASLLITNALQLFMSLWMNGLKMSVEDIGSPFFMSLH